MPVPGHVPPRPRPGPPPATLVSGRYAAGQLLALVPLVLLAVPLLPALFLLVVWLRLRDRRPFSH